MVIVAAVCVAAGSWQIARLHTKATENTALRHNAHAATAPVASVLPLAGHGKTPSRRSIEFRPVTATGTYEADRTSLVRHRTVDSDIGFLVVTPLHTGSGTLLVVRGFIAESSSPTVPTAPRPPSGQVTVAATIRPGESKNDQAGHLTRGQVESINPGEQASRLGEPVFAGYGELVAGQPGSAQLVPNPKPDLSNPAGGAIEPQHLAYIIQWYLFALLALAAPVAMVRAETRERSTDDIDAAPAEPPPTPSAGERTPEQLREAKLADRYGRAVR
jgi:cytochrome oxidase assembly protein ShyY1